MWKKNNIKHPLSSSGETINYSIIMSETDGGRKRRQKSFCYWCSFHLSIHVVNSPFLWKIIQTHSHDARCASHAAFYYILQYIYFLASNAFLIPIKCLFHVSYSSHSLTCFPAITSISLMTTCITCYVRLVRPATSPDDDKNEFIEIWIFLS